MILRSFEDIKNTLNTNYKIINLEDNSYKNINDNSLIDFTHKFLNKHDFINGIGWGETNITKQNTSLYVVKGMEFARKVAMVGKADLCPIISYCVASQKQIKFYSEIILDPTCSKYKDNLEILKIRNNEGVSHGMNINCQKIIKNQEIMINIFISWGDKKVKEKKFFDKQYEDIKKFLDLSVDYIKKI